MSLTADDANGWPLVAGARIRAERGYTLRRRPKARSADADGSDEAEDFLEALQGPAGEPYRPTHECIVISVIPRPKTGGVAVLARCTATHGLRHFAPESCRVVTGDSTKSRVVRELVEAKLVREKVAERKAAIKEASVEAKELMKKGSRPVPQEAAMTNSSAPSEESRQVPGDLSFLD